MSGTMLAVQAVSKRFGGVVANHAISISIIKLLLPIKRNQQKPWLNFTMDAALKKLYLAMLNKMPVSM